MNDEAVDMERDALLMGDFGLQLKLLETGIAVLWMQRPIRSSPACEAEFIVTRWRCPPF